MPGQNAGTVLAQPYLCLSATASCVRFTIHRAQSNKHGMPTDPCRAEGGFFLSFSALHGNCVAVTLHSGLSEHRSPYFLRCQETRAVNRRASAKFVKGSFSKLGDEDPPNVNCSRG